METQVIRDFYNRIIGYIETDRYGNKIVKDFYKRILGRYDAKHRITRDFYNRIVGKGDLTTMLLNQRRR